MRDILNYVWPLNTHNFILVDYVFIICVYNFVSSLLLLKDSGCIISLFLCRILEIFIENRIHRNCHLNWWINKRAALTRTIGSTTTCSLKWRKDGEIYYKCLDYLVSVTVFIYRRVNYSNEDFKVHHGS